MCVCVCGGVAGKMHLLMYIVNPAGEQVCMKECQLALMCVRVPVDIQRKANGN